MWLNSLCAHGVNLVRNSKNGHECVDGVSAHEHGTTAQGRHRHVLEGLGVAVGGRQCGPSRRRGRARCFAVKRSDRGVDEEARSKVVLLHALYNESE